MKPRIQSQLATQLYFNSFSNASLGPCFMFGPESYRLDLLEERSLNQRIRPIDVWLAIKAHHWIKNNTRTNPPALRTTSGCWTCYHSLSLARSYSPCRPIVPPLSLALFNLHSWSVRLENLHKTVGRTLNTEAIHGTRKNIAFSMNKSGPIEKWK